MFFLLFEMEILFFFINAISPFSSAINLFVFPIKGIVSLDTNEKLSELLTNNPPELPILKANNVSGSLIEKPTIEEAP